MASEQRVVWHNFATVLPSKIRLSPTRFKILCRHKPLKNVENIWRLLAFIVRPSTQQMV
jgi:hypothetical protein